MSDAYTSPFAGIDQLDPPKSQLECAEEIEKRKVDFLRSCFMESAKKNVNPPPGRGDTIEEEPEIEKLDLEIIKEVVNAPPRRLNGWHVEETDSGFAIVKDKEEETDAERYDRVMNSLLENPLK